MINVAVVGYGNIGKRVLDILRCTPDFKLTGLVRRNKRNPPPELEGVELAEHVGGFSKKPDIAILCVPTRSIPHSSRSCLELGISAVDSYDIHSGIWDLKKELNPVAKMYGAVSIHAAGWDPGSDSVVRALMQAAVPSGITYTNFGPGMSMGHTVAAKSVEGVKEALSMTLPLGASMHRRMVYVELKKGHTLEEISAKIKEDPYFANDETIVQEVPSVSALMDMGHGVNMERKGSSGSAQNQRMAFSMSVNNPALTAQLLVGAARAAMKQRPGAYTMIEIPVIDLLPGSTEDLIRALV